MTSYVWNAPAGGNWSDATNWMPNGVPGASDTVTIGLAADTSALTVTLDTSPFIADLTLNGAQAP